MNHRTLSRLSTWAQLTTPSSTNSSLKRGKCKSHAWMKRSIPEKIDTYQNKASKTPNDSIRHRFMRNLPGFYRLGAGPPVLSPLYTSWPWIASESSLVFVVQWPRKSYKPLRHNTTPTPVRSMLALKQKRQMHSLVLSRDYEILKEWDWSYLIAQFIEKLVPLKRVATIERSSKCIEEPVAVTVSQPKPLARNVNLLESLLYTPKWPIPLPISYAWWLQSCHLSFEPTPILLEKLYIARLALRIYHSPSIPNLSYLFKQWQPKLMTLSNLEWFIKDLKTVHQNYVLDYRLDELNWIAFLQSCSSSYGLDSERVWTLYCWHVAPEIARNAPLLALKGWTILMTLRKPCLEDYIPLSSSLSHLTNFQSRQLFISCKKEQWGFFIAKSIFNAKMDSISSLSPIFEWIYFEPNREEWIESLFKGMNELEPTLKTSEVSDLHFLILLEKTLLEQNNDKLWQLFRERGEDKVRQIKLTATFDHVLHQLAKEYLESVEKLFFHLFEKTDSNNLVLTWNFLLEEHLKHLRFEKCIHILNYCKGMKRTHYNPLQWPKFSFHSLLTSKQPTVDEWLYNEIETTSSSQWPQRLFNEIYSNQIQIQSGSFYALLLREMRLCKANPGLIEKLVHWMDQSQIIPCASLYAELLFFSCIAADHERIKTFSILYENYPSLCRDLKGWQYLIIYRARYGWQQSNQFSFPNGLYELNQLLKRSIVPSLFVFRSVSVAMIIRWGGKKAAPYCKMLRQWMASKGRVPDASFELHHLQAFARIRDLNALHRHFSFMITNQVELVSNEAILFVLQTFLLNGNLFQFRQMVDLILEIEHFSFEQIHFENFTKLKKCHSFGKELERLLRVAVPCDIENNEHHNYETYS